jgi:hypothetical protein
MGFKGSGNPDEDQEILREETKGSSMLTEVGVIVTILLECGVGKFDIFDVYGCVSE